MQPKVTVVTITYNIIKSNRENFFKQCVESVHNQTYRNIEHIIIDGASNDGTIDLIKHYADKDWINYYSEPDTGIYDAMNKGIYKASGDYIVFLNSDDFFHEKNGIEISINTLIGQHADFTYSNARYLTENNKYFGELVSVPESFYIRMPVCHQSLIVSTELMRKLNGFDDHFKNAGDYEFILRLFLSGAKGIQTKCVFVSYRLGGMSDVNSQQSRKECIDAYRKNFKKYSDGISFDYKLMWDGMVFPIKLFNNILKDVHPSLRNIMLSDWNSYEKFNPEYKKISKITYISKRFDKTKEFLKKYLGIKKVSYNNKTKKYFLGIPVLKTKYRDTNIKIYLLSIFPFVKIKLLPTVVKLNLLGVQICSYKRVINIVEKKYDNIEDIIIHALKKLLNRKTHSDKIAAFGIIPPEVSGIADYNLKTFKDADDKFDVFSDIRNTKEYFNLINNKVDNIFPLCLCDVADYISHYKHKLYIFGNCHQHKKIFENAISTKGEVNRSMQLHEPWLFGMINPTFEGKFEEYKHLVIDSYPNLKYEIMKCPDIPQIMVLLCNHGYCGLRIVINATGIKNIFVNNDIAIQMVHDELKDSSIRDVNVKLSFLPIEKIESNLVDLRENPEQKIIATFGIPQEAKMTDTLIEAVRLLNERDHLDYKLILAGYYVNQYLQSHRYNFDFIIPLDSPDTDTLFSLMKSSDLTVQLRKKPHGESSACIVQLLGMEQNIVTSENFLSKELEKYCHIVPRDVSPLELRNYLKDFIAHPVDYSIESISRQYSFSNLAELLYREALTFVEH